MSKQQQPGNLSMGLAPIATKPITKRFLAQDDLRENIKALKAHWEETTRDMEPSQINFSLYMDFIFQDVMRVIDNLPG